MKPKAWHRSIRYRAICAIPSLLCLIPLIVSACKPLPSHSQLSDIYKIDESKARLGNQRRHQAVRAEARWTVEAMGRGCSGILISPSHMLTSSHCNPQVGDRYRTGIAAVGSGGANLEVTVVLEKGKAETIDYALLQIRWLQAMDFDQTFPPFMAMSSADLMTSQLPDEGETVFAVGFPTDKNKIWSVTYAEGQLKTMSSDKLLRYNAGVIEGNSGGGLLKSDNQMLVGLVKGGPHKMAEASWKGNDLDHPAAWNSAVAIWDIAAVSPILRSIYPNGKHYSLRNSFVPRTQIYLAMEPVQEGYRLWATAGFGVSQLVLCPLSKISCKAGEADVQILEAAGRKGDRYRYFIPSARNDWTQTSLQIFAYDGQGQLLAKRRVKLIKAGAS